MRVCICAEEDGERAVMLMHRRTARWCANHAEERCRQELGRRSELGAIIAARCALPAPSEAIYIVGLRIPIADPHGLLFKYRELRSTLRSTPTSHQYTISTSRINRPLTASQSLPALGLRPRVNIRLRKPE